MIIDKIIDKNKSTKKIINKLFVILLFSFIVWAYGLNIFVNNIPHAGVLDDSNADAIVILTGGSQRLEEGLRLLAKKRANKMFISGVGEDANLANLLLNSGYVPANIAQIAKNIELGYKAENTKGNAYEVYDWVKKNDAKSIILVTANYHMPRSVVEFERKLDEIKIIPHPVTPDSFNIENWVVNPVMRKVLTKEYNKYLITKIGLSV